MGRPRARPGARDRQRSRPAGQGGDGRRPGAIRRQRARPGAGDRQRCRPAGQGGDGRRPGAIGRRQRAGAIRRRAGPARRRERPGRRGRAGAGRQSAGAGQQRGRRAAERRTQCPAGLAERRRPAAGPVGLADRAGLGRRAAGWPASLGSPAPFVPARAAKARDPLRRLGQRPRPRRDRRLGRVRCLCRDRRLGQLRCLGQDRRLGRVRCLGRLRRPRPRIPWVRRRRSPARSIRAGRPRIQPPAPLPAPGLPGRRSVHAAAVSGRDVPRPVPPAAAARRGTARPETARPGTA